VILLLVIQRGLFYDRALSPLQTGAIDFGLGLPNRHRVHGFINAVLARTRLASRRLRRGSRERQTGPLLYEAGWGPTPVRAGRQTEAFLRVALTTLRDIHCKQQSKCAVRETSDNLQRRLSSSTPATSPTRTGQPAFTTFPIRLCLWGSRSPTLSPSAGIPPVWRVR